MLLFLICCMHVHVHVCRGTRFVDLLITKPQLKRTALHLAKDVETVKILVAAGADLDAKDAVRK